jgi:hypothetical protein
MTTLLTLTSFGKSTRAEGVITPNMGVSEDMGVQAGEAAPPETDKNVMGKAHNLSATKSERAILKPLLQANNLLLEQPAR